MRGSVAAITEGQSRILHEAMLDLMLEAEAAAVILCDRGGNILANTSWNEASHVEHVAALAAGTFAATQELAVMTGESGFRSVSHEGHNASLYIERVADDYLVIVQFTSATTLGLVKLYTEKAAQKIEGLLRMVMQQDSTSTVHAERMALHGDADAPVFAAPASARS